MSSSKPIVLMSSDGETFEVDEHVAKMSQTIGNIIDDGCVDSSIPLPIVTSKTLAMVIEYCKKHAKTPTQETDDKVTEEEVKAKNDEKVSEKKLKDFDAEFVKVDDASLFDLILAANYLNIKDLLDLACQTVADNIKDKTSAQVRKIFNIKNDFTPEEEEKLRKENAWAYE